MTKDPTSSTQARDGGRAERLLQLIEDVVARRTAGEILPDDAVIAANSDLMPELRLALDDLRRVEEARRAAAQPETAPSTLGVDLDPSREQFLTPLPDSFPGYQLVREVHRGAQGVVYQAIQKATKRKVAIKVMREGPFAGPTDKVRFEREVHILAVLNHPNMVTVHDSGTARSGHAYFVMDYISGQPLDVYMASGERSIEETLRLFGKICGAINAAHLRGIIHRDLKPSNVRVDAGGEPHVLDFGLAKVAMSDVTASTSPQIMTVTGQFVGSLPWASPEQAAADPNQIDIRTDVYSLGVILYQMLTGKFPYEVVGNMRDVLDRILKTEPARPSTIRRQINDEVETIVLKCLSKERDRRYQSAGELARDIGHYLSGEPIEAKRDSGWYVLRKLARRYTVPAAVSAAFLVLLIASTLVAWTYYSRAARAAEALRREGGKLVATKQFLEQMLTSVSPNVALGRDVTVREVLEVSAARANDELSAEPEVLAEILSTMGFSYYQLGLYEQAESQLRSAREVWELRVGTETAVIGDILNNLGAVLNRRAKYEEAEQVLRSSIDIRRRIQEDDSGIAQSFINLGAMLRQTGALDRARECARDALSVLVSTCGEDSVESTQALTLLGAIAKDKTEYQEAEQLFRRVIAIRQKASGRNHPDVARAMNNLASVLTLKGDFEPVAALYSEIIDIQHSIYTDDDPSIATTLNNFGTVLEEWGKLSEAEEKYRGALDIRSKRLDSSNPELLDTSLNLGNVWRRMKRYPDAESMLRDVLERSRSRKDYEKGISSAVHALGHLLLEMDRAQEALPLLEESVRIRKERLAKGHWLTAHSESVLGECLLVLERYEEAEPLLLNSFEIIKIERPNRIQTREALERIIRLYDAWGRPEKAARFRDVQRTIQEAKE